MLTRLTFMKRVLAFAFFALFALGSAVNAQASASISPNNINDGDSITVTMTGLDPNTSYTVQVLGVGVNPYGIKSNTSRVVVTDATGEASWVETISWGANTYATQVDFSTGGSSGSEAAGNLTVN